MAQGKVLLVEDDAILLNIYSTKLKMEGFEVVTAENGEDGIQAAQTEKPGIILLDILFPGEMTGLDALKKLKSQPETMNIPVVLLTNLEDDKTISEGLKLGAIGYFVKANTSPGDIITTINNFISS